jgi:hypothetical protein
MVEEIRSYLLNSQKYSSRVYLDESFDPVKLTKELGEFRASMLGEDNLTDLDQQIYRANFISQEIYAHKDLSKVALELFDNRLIDDTTFINESFDPKILVDSKNTNLLISVIPGAILEREIVNQDIEISKSTNTNKLNIKVSSLIYSVESEAMFSFSGGLSSFVDIPRTPIRIAFRGVNSIPSNFSKVFINVRYPYFFDINKSIEKVRQMGSLDFFIFQNNSASKSLLSVYNSLSRWNDRLMCLALGYAINLKYR